MQNAETVLSVLRERGRRGLPLDELYRQLFNPQLYLLAYGRIYSNKGAMTPGPDAETADGMTLGKIERISTRCVASATDSSPSGATTSQRRTGSSGRLVCLHGRTSCSAKSCVFSWRRITSRSSPIIPTVIVLVVAATPPCATWPSLGPGRPGLSKVISPAALTSSTTRSCWRRSGRRSTITGCFG